ncbi:hypothetical protein BDV18DRAFT_139781 [Aspergillus unguis]
MSFSCISLTLINPLHRETCIASSPHRGVCPESIDSTIRELAHLELALSKPENRAKDLRNAARLMICGNHKNQSQEARRIARLWEDQATQQPNAIIHSLASTDIPTYKQTPQSQTPFKGGIVRHSRGI